MLQGKLTAQQLYIRANGKEKDEVSLWMTALVTAETEGVDGSGTTEPVTTVVEKTVPNAPAWAIGALDGLDAERVAEAEPLSAGISIGAVELSKEVI